MQVTRILGTFLDKVLEAAEAFYGGVPGLNLVQRAEGRSLREEVAEEVPHCHWTFTVPKLLRPFFLHRRALVGELCRAAWESVAELTAEAAGDDVRPGMVAAVHTAASDLRWHPHIHAIASRGGWIGRVHGALCRGATLTPPSL